MVKKTVKKLPLEPVFQLWAWVLLLWSLYRYFFKLPEWTDEFIFKPLIFVLPVLWVVTKCEKRPLDSIGLTTKRLTTGILMGVAVGCLFMIEGMAVHWIKKGSLSIQPLDVLTQYGFPMLIVLSLATAFSEEILTRGYLFSRLFERTKRLWFSILTATVLFSLLHVPILVTSLRFQGMTLIFFFLTNFILGVLNNVLFYQSGSLVAPILVHVFWNVTVVMFL